MDPKHSALSKKLRVQYERGRLLHALWISFLFLPFWLLLECCSPHPGESWSSIGLGILFGVFALWKGKSLQKGFLPGIVCGLFPYLTAQLAQSMGHFCMDHECYSLCAPLCASGGLIAGWVLTYQVRSAANPLVAFSGASFMVVVIGKTGCSCLGWGSLFGILGGLLVGGIRLWSSNLKDIVSS